MVCRVNKYGTQLTHSLYTVLNTSTQTSNTETHNMVYNETVATTRTRCIRHDLMHTQAKGKQWYIKYGN